MLEEHLRQAATALLETAIRIAPPDTQEWGMAMRGELNYVRGSWAVLGWALGGASVLAKGALAAFLFPGRQAQGLPPDGGLFGKTISLRKAALAAGGACVVGALLFLLAPPFRQGMEVSFAVWRRTFPITAEQGQPELTALARQAEANRDPEALAFCAVRTWDAHESARLAEEAVKLDPRISWIYAVVAARHFDLPGLQLQLLEIQRGDPQNAIFPLIAAISSKASHYSSSASRLPPDEVRKQVVADPAWQAAMAAVFRSARLDDYHERLEELDRDVISRYRSYDPYAVLEGEDYDVAVRSYEDMQLYGELLVQQGQDLEARGERHGAAEKFWTVARFGQLLDSHARTDIAHLSGTQLQALAYKQLQALSEKEGNSDEAALFGYLVQKFSPHQVMLIYAGGRWVFGEYVAGRNAAFLQLSGFLILIFSGMLLVSATILGVGVWRRTTRARPAATAVAVASAIGLLLSSATIYLTYRPYWYLLQRVIVNGDRSGARDLRYFLTAAQTPLGMGDSYLFLHNFPVYFWTGVTALGLLSLAFIFLRHFRARARVRSST